MTVTCPSFGLDAPARYRICALGRFHPDWLDMLSGEWVIAESQSSRPDVTTLVGQVLDQAALLGVLEQLYSLGLPLLSVEQLTPRSHRIRERGP